MRKIRIKAGSIEASAELNDSQTATAIWDALPLSVPGSTWGDEIYFAIPVDMPEDGAQAVVALGDLGYWPPGNAFCIFFGPTPMSTGSEIRPASPVNIVGRVIGDPTVFKDVHSGERVTLERVP